MTALHTLPNCSLLEQEQTLQRVDKKVRLSHVTLHQHGTMRGQIKPLRTEPYLTSTLSHTLYCNLVKNNLKKQLTRLFLVNYFMF